jgi:hypothetical protein
MYIPILKAPDMLAKGAGKEGKKQLEKLGIQVLHDKESLPMTYLGAHVEVGADVEDSKSTAEKNGKLREGKNAHKRGSEICTYKCKLEMNNEEFSVVNSVFNDPNEIQKWVVINVPENYLELAEKYSRKNGLTTEAYVEKVFIQKASEMLGVDRLTIADKIVSFPAQNTRPDKAALLPNLLLLGDSARTGHFYAGAGVNSAIVFDANNVVRAIEDVLKTNLETAFKNYQSNNEKVAKG